MGACGELAGMQCGGAVQELCSQPAVLGMHFQRETPSFLPPDTPKRLWWGDDGSGMLKEYPSQTLLQLAVWVRRKI